MRYVHSIDESDPLAFEPLGNIRTAYETRCDELVVSGGVNTGKTYGNMQRAHELAATYPGCQVLLLRKTLSSLMKTGVRTYETQVLDYPPGDPRCPIIKVEKREATYYLYPNGSQIWLGGMNKKGDVLSAEYDFIIVVQCEDLTEEEWVYLLTRKGRGAGNNAPYSMVIGDANPHPVGEQHWIPRRARKSLVLINSTRRDNPALWDRVKQEWTKRGQEIEDMLQTFPEDVRKRLGDGIWIGGDNLVYQGDFNEGRNLVTYDDLRANKVEFEKFYMGCDWGYSDPGSLSLYTFSTEPCLYQYRTTYRTNEEGPFWVNRAVAYDRWCRRYYGKGVERVYCDPRRPDRIAEFVSAGLPAVAAPETGQNSILPGVVRVKYWLKHGLFKIVRDNIDGNKAFGEPGADPRLLSTYRPTCLYDEISRFYQNPGKDKLKEGNLDVNPLPGHDHSADELRYVISAIYLPSAPILGRSITFSEAEFMAKMGLGIAA